MKHKLTMANALSVLRIILSVALLAPPALSPAFLVLYAAAGLTDMLDDVEKQENQMTSPRPLVRKVTASHFGCRDRRSVN